MLLLEIAMGRSYQELHSRAIAVQPVAQPPEVCNVIPTCRSPRPFDDLAQEGTGQGVVQAAAGFLARRARGA